MSPADASEVAVTIAALHIHPVKSCAGIEVAKTLLVETGLELDRWWMVVDASGQAVTQRELPRMALVRTAWRLNDVVLRAPGMLPLHLAIDVAEGDTRVRLWDDDLPALDMGNLAAQWFSDFLGQPLRLARFDPEHRRLSSKRWTGAVDALNAFADAYPLLVIGRASLDELNRRLAARGAVPAEMARFRPNLVLEGLPAHDEDHVEELVFDGDGGPVRLRLVKPCTRCTLPNVDPATGVAGVEPGDTLATYRADARVDGKITFGMNAVVVEGIDAVLRRGMAGRARYAFG